MRDLVASPRNMYLVLIAIRDHQQMKTTIHRTNERAAAALLAASALLGCVLGQSAYAAGSTPCENVYRAKLMVHIENEDRTRAINWTGPLPIKLIGGEKELLLEVTRIDDQWLQVDAGYIVNAQAQTWFVRIQMDQGNPVAYSRKFRPAPGMAPYTLELIPACKPA